MVTVPFALYDAFSDTAFGGSQAGVVSDAAWLDANARRRIAREVGAPATGFVTACGDHSIMLKSDSGMNWKAKRAPRRCGGATPSNPGW